MAKFKFDDSTTEIELPVKFCKIEIQEFIVESMKILGFKREKDEKISHMNGKPFEECSIADVKPDEINILQIQPSCHLSYHRLADDVRKYVRTNPSRKDIERFIKIIDAVHRVPGSLGQFIVIYATSLSGKTQLAISLDQYTDNPLCPRDNTVAPEAYPLRACFRLSCSNIFSEGEPGQLINASPIERRKFKPFVSADYDILEKAKGEDDLSVEGIESIADVSAVSETFSVHPSKTLGFFAAWIRSRLDGSESIAFGKSSSLKIDICPLTIGQFMEEFQISNSKPLVFVFDDFCPAVHQKPEDGYFIFLRNLLRACGVVVIVMGTNSSTVSLIDKVPAERLNSGSNPLLWAQVVTNVFSCTPINQFVDPDKLQNCLQERGLSPSDVTSIMNWVNEGRCFKPGTMKTLISGLCYGRRISSPAEAVWEALQQVTGEFSSRKSGLKKIYNILGQVKTMLSTTRFADELKHLVSSAPMSEHYASLATYTNHPSINLFSLIRAPHGSEMQLFPLSWEPSDLDIELAGSAVNNDCPSERMPYTIRNYLENDSAKAVYPVQPSADSKFIPTTGYPAYESDEISFLGLFALEKLMIYDKGLDQIAIHEQNLDNFRDLLHKPKPGPYLSTRTALTIAFRYWQGNEDSSVTQIAKNRNDFFLEVVGASAMVIASHKFGLGGSKLAQFIPAFINELAWKKMEKIELSDASLKELGAFANFMIPFFPMISSTCSPTLRAISGVNSGTLKMARDKDEIDFVGYADCLRHPNPEALPKRRVIITGGLKNREENIDGSLLVSVENALEVAESLATTLIEERNDNSIQTEAHFHFAVIANHADIQEKRWEKLTKEYPDVSVYLASGFGRFTGKLELPCIVRGRQPGSLQTNQNTLASDDQIKRLIAGDIRKSRAELFSRFEFDELSRSESADAQEIGMKPFPTCVILVPIENLLKDGPVDITLPCDVPIERSAKRGNLGPEPKNLVRKLN